MSGSPSNCPSEPVRLKRAFIYDEHKGYFSAMLIGSRRSIKIKDIYEGQAGIGCFIRVALSNSEDDHMIKTADSGDLKSHVDNNTERVFEAEGFFTGDNPTIIFQEDFGQLSIKMPRNLARQDGDKAIAIRIEEVGDICEINAQPLIECEGLVVTNAIARGIPTSYIFISGCRSYSDVYFVADSVENLPPVGNFVRLLIQFVFLC
ncbi:hypothetical protein WR25_02786 [Diploscapter pachys]|uniref:Uncharacterized protein n=1 Tax=Diploscapter pachys TaxID=2018661 RepID=A0A2A2KMH4_9BILA|nr:hypothetical protein WR25_02786 [Diploscapter pachys]